MFHDFRKVLSPHVLTSFIIANPSKMIDGIVLYLHSLNAVWLSNPAYPLRWWDKLSIGFENSRMHFLVFFKIGMDHVFNWKSRSSAEIASIFFQHLEMVLIFIEKIMRHFSETFSMSVRSMERRCNQINPLCLSYLALFDATALRLLEVVFGEEYWGHQRWWQSFHGGNFALHLRNTWQELFRFFFSHHCAMIYIDVHESAVIITSSVTWFIKDLHDLALRESQKWIET